MITKEQALTCTSFKQTKAILTHEPQHLKQVASYQLDKPINWRANGKCKTWKRSPERFQLPIKHGLYSYGYITEENAHLFETIS